MKESKVSNIKTYGKSLIIEFNNNDSGFLNGYGIVAPVAIGDVVKYTIEEKQKKDGSGNYKVVTLPEHPVTEEKTNKSYSGSGRQRKEEPFEHKSSGFAASYAKDIMVAQGIKISEFETYFDIIYNKIISKKVN